MIKPGTKQQVKSPLSSTFQYFLPHFWYFGSISVLFQPRVKYNCPKIPIIKKKAYSVISYN